MLRSCKTDNNNLSNPNNYLLQQKRNGGDEKRYLGKRKERKTETLRINKNGELILKSISGYY